MTIGILMTTSPEYQNSQTVCALSKALLSSGNRVSLFLMDDGIYNVVCRYSDGVPNPFEDLHSQGMTLSLCRQSAEKRGLQEDDCIAGVGWLSQIELAAIIDESDRFMTFGT